VEEALMATKPRTASGYDKRHVAHVRATCLYVATRLGDLLDEVVVVGGLVPSLLIDQGLGGEDHIGTADLDIGLALAVFDDKRYQALTDRLRQAGFGPDVSEKGNPTRQRWKIDGPPVVTVDFLIPPAAGDAPGSQIKDIEDDFAAIITPALRFAFVDRVNVTLDGLTIRGERARRGVWVCGPGAFVIMKALALRGRGENKDAYDLVYLLRHHPAGIGGIAARLKPLLGEPEAREAIGYLDEDFATIDSIGPIRAAEFIHDARNEDAEADAWGAARDLLDRLLD
jgi:hypothetical protein